MNGTCWHWGNTTAYQRGAFRNTRITASADGATRTVQVTIGAAEGTFKNAMKRRAWVLRIHHPVGWPKNLEPIQVAANGRIISSSIRRLTRDEATMPFGDKAGAPDADVFELKLPSASVTTARQAEITFAPASR